MSEVAAVVCYCYIEDRGVEWPLLSRWINILRTEEAKSEVSVLSMRTNDRAVEALRKRQAWHSELSGSLSRPGIHGYHRLRD